MMATFLNSLQDIIHKDLMKIDEAIESNGDATYIESCLLCLFATIRLVVMQLGDQGGWEEFGDILRALQDKAKTRTSKACLEVYIVLCGQLAKKK
jgi:hypothetical protein